MKEPRYTRILEKVFLNHHEPGMTEFVFDREEFSKIANEMGIRVPKNQGNIPYTFRYRADLPASILERTPEGRSWIILGAGKAKYQFLLGEWPNIVPQSGREKIKIFDATPEIIKRYSLSDEQAALARVRYNRLIDIFLGITT